MNAPFLREAKPYIFFGQTTSLCDICKSLSPAKICVEGDDVFYEKRCPVHGVRKALVSTDAGFFRWQRDFLKPGDRPRHLGSHIEYGCPYDCGLCPDHEQHTCLAIIEINEACDLTCPVCFASSSTELTKHLPIAAIERMFDTLVEAEGEPDVVQLSGGEPTLHPEFFEILSLAKSKPIRHVMVNTNGLRLAKDEAFVARLAPIKNRGRNLSAIRFAAPRCTRGNPGRRFTPHPPAGAGKSRKA
jgi:7,8-dihydro-6-hydroxymethylpterin dimethyltransferase